MVGLWEIVFHCAWDLGGQAVKLIPLLTAMFEKSNVGQLSGVRTSIVSFQSRWHLKSRLNCMSPNVGLIQFYIIIMFYISQILHHSQSRGNSYVACLYPHDLKQAKREKRTGEEIWSTGKRQAAFFFSCILPQGQSGQSFCTKVKHITTSSHSSQARITLLSVTS